MQMPQPIEGIFDLPMSVTMQSYPVRPPSPVHHDSTSADSNDGGTTALLSGPEPKEAGKSMLMSLIITMMVFCSLALICISIFNAVGITNAPAVPLIRLNGTIFSLTATPGSKYYLLLRTSATELDLSTLPTSLDPNHVSNIFPAQLAHTCEIRSGIQGDMIVDTQTLAVIFVSVNSSLVSMGVLGTSSVVVPIKVMSCILGLSVGVLQGFLVMAFTWRFTNSNAHFNDHREWLNRRGRWVLGACFTITNVIGTLIVLNMITKTTWQTFFAWTMWSLTDGAIFWALLYYADAVVAGRMVTNNALYARTSTVRAMMTSMYLLMMLESLKALFLGLRTHNYGLISILTDWAPLYTPGLGSLSEGTVWVFLAGLYFPLIVVMPGIVGNDCARLVQKYSNFTVEELAVQEEYEGRTTSLLRYETTKRDLRRKTGVLLLIFLIIYTLVTLTFLSSVNVATRSPVAMAC